MATFCRVLNGGALVTACTAPTQLTLSANNVGFGQTVTLSWTGAQGGAGNPIAGYEVYRDGLSLGTVTQASMAVQSPAQNGSYAFTVRTKGTIPGFDSPVSVASAMLTSLVTAPAAPASVWLSAQDVKLSGSATLSWSAAAGGTNNPVAGYAIYRGGAAFTTVAAGVTTLVVTAPATDGASYAFTVKALGTVAGFDSAASAAVTLTAHAPQHVDSYFTSSGTYTVPWWAERVDVTCIGAGGGGSARFGDGGGGCGGGSGYISHKIAVAVAPGAAVAVTVGAGGARGLESAPAGNQSRSGVDGGASSFGSLVSAGGGQRGIVHTPAWIIPENHRGGSGGAGGGGGGRASGASSNTSLSGGPGLNTSGGGTGTGTYGVSGGGGGSYKGTNGTAGAGGNWDVPGKDGAGVGGTGANTDEYYCFSDPATQRYLKAQGGNGGRGSYGATPGAGGRGGNVGKDARGAALAGSGYGHGGRGSDDQADNSAAGGSGLVAVRAWRYL